MPQSQYRARQIGAKTHEVFEYDRNEDLPGKPLHILIPGGLIALAALALIVFIAYQTWFAEQLSRDTGSFLILLLAPFYVGGVFLFSYGYELYNIPRAIRLTVIIVFVTVAAVVIVAVLFFLLGESKGGSGRTSSSRSSSRSYSSNNRGTRAGGIIGAAGVASQKSSSSSAGRTYSGTDVFIGGGPGGVRTREVTKEVVREVPVVPKPITCPFCSRSYVPVEHNYICPSCGAATPQNLIDESQEPKRN